MRKRRRNARTATGQTSNLSEPDRAVSNSVLEYTKSPEPQLTSRTVVAAPGSSQTSRNSPIALVSLTTERCRASDISGGSYASLLSISELAPSLVAG
jgi:hypothetical protein